MKRLMVLLLAVAFLFAGTALAANVKDKSGKAVVDKGGKPVATKTAKMTATGKIVDLSDAMLSVERSVKGKVETMEFALDKPLAGMKVGDKVTVHYVVKDGKNVATKVTKSEATKKTEKPKKK
jgi:hypothetical protein